LHTCRYIFGLEFCNVYHSVHILCFQGELGTPGAVGPPGVQGAEGAPGVYDPNLDEAGGPGVVGPQGPLGLYPNNDMRIIFLADWMFK
jgi:hypothetical protein